MFSGAARLFSPLRYNPKTMTDKVQIITTISTGIAVITVTIALGSWLSADIRAIRSDMREDRATAKADSDKNRDQLAAHLTNHAAE